MKIVTTSHAKSQFSAILRFADQGNEVLVTRRGVPVARIVPERAAKERYFANDEGLGFIPDDFNGALPHDVIRPFFG